MKNKLRKINTILSIFNVHINKGSYFFRPSTKIMRSFNKKDLVCIEIGVYKGRNALSILQNLDVKKLFLIDPFVKYTDFTKKENSVRLVSNAMFNKTKVRLLTYLDKVEFIKQTSQESIKLFKDNSIDFIYIDANHGYDFVKRDIELYYPKVKKGGVFAGDDINIPDVFKAVSEFCVKNKLRCRIKRGDWIIVK